VWTVAVVALVALAVVLGGSISGMAGAGVAVLLWLFARGVRTSERVAVIGTLAVALIAVSLAGGNATSPVQRLQQVTGTYVSQPGAGSAQDRIAIARAMWPRILENPLVGTGLDKQGSAITVISAGASTTLQAHGAPLTPWYEAGIFGLLGYIVLVVGTLTVGWRSMKTARTQDDQVIGLALLTSFIAFIVFTATSPFYFQAYGWFSSVLIVAWLYRSDARQPVPASDVATPDRQPARLTARPGLPASSHV
jgi:O-antigen ligase